MLPQQNTFYCRSKIPFTAAVKSSRLPDPFPLNRPTQLGQLTYSLASTHLFTCPNSHFHTQNFLLTKIFCRIFNSQAGFAIASPGDFESVRQIARTVKNSTVASLSRALTKDIDAAAVLDCPD